MRKIHSSFFVLGILFLMAGCSGNPSPLTPWDNPSPTAKSYSSLPVAVSDYDSKGNPTAGLGILGVFNVHLDRDTLTGSLSSLRNAGSTDVLEVVDISNFLRMAPCTNCVKLMSVELDSDSHLVAKIGIKHPFSAGDPAKPISGRNRADLHVFNIEGLVVSDGTGTTSFTGIGRTIGNVELLNADGYSNYLDGALDEIFPTVADLHPYVLHFDDYSAGNYDQSNPMGFESVTDPPPTGNLIMAMGCDYNVQDYVFDIAGSIDFIYAVECTYALSADSKPQRFNPEYRIPQHNKKAASEVKVAVTSDDLKAGIETSSADLEIRVVDINHGVGVGTALNEMKADSSVNGIFVEVPGVTTSSVSLGSTPVSGTGHSPSDPLIFTGKIYNTAKGAVGTYTGLVKVLDSYPPASNTSAALIGFDGIKRVEPLTSPMTGLFSINEFATYFPFTVSVETANELPQCVIFTCGGATPSVNIDGHLRLDGTQSIDPDGTIETYEWDMDYDGTNFTSDATGEYGWFTGTTAGTYTVALRVTDDMDGQSICTIQVACTGNPRGWLPPVRVTNTPVNYYDRTEYPYANSLDVSKDCTVHLAYYTWKTDAPNARQVLYTKYDGTSWSAPEHIRDFDNSYVMSVALRLDSKDQVHIGFCISNEIFYANNTSGAFTVQTLNSGSLGYANLSFAINKDDQMMIAVAEDFSSTYPLYIQTYYNSGSGFGTPVTAGSYCNQRSPSSGVVVEPDICASPDGNFHIVFNGLVAPPCPSTDSNRRIYYSEFDGTSWTEYGAISNIPGDCHQPRICSDLDNNLHCIVGGYSYLYYAKRDAVTLVWSGFDYITPSNYLSYQPDIEIDRWGNVYISWTSTSTYTGFYKIFNVADDIATIKAKPTFGIPPGAGGQFVMPHLHVDFDGDLHAVFEDRTLGEWTNTELYYERYH